MRSLNTLLLVGFAALTGCSDSGSVSGVYPSTAFLGRTVRVEVSGDNVEWKDGATLDFGPNVTVSNVTIASRTSIFADVTIGEGALPGLRDVIVRQGNDSKTLAQSFELTSPLQMTYQGKLAQGSIVAFTARNLDFFSPFDTTCTMPGLFGCMEYGNMSVTTPDGMMAYVSFVDPYEVSGYLYIDIDATTGPVTFVSGPPDEAAEQVMSPVGLPVEIAARTATALSMSPTTATVEDTFDSQLYEFTANAGSLARFQVTPSDPNASPLLFLLPDSGHFNDMIAVSDSPKAFSPNGEKFYAVYVDAGGASGYTYNARANSIPMMTVAEAANDTAATPQAMTMSAVYYGPATLSSDTDEDWIRIPVSTSDATKKVHVFTTGTDTLTDTVVQIYKNTGNAADLIGEGDDSGFHEDVTSDVIGGSVTQILVKISASSFFDPQHKSYFAGIWIE